MQNSYALLDDLIVIFSCAEHLRYSEASTDDFFNFLLAFKSYNVLLSEQNVQRYECILISLYDFWFAFRFNIVLYGCVHFFYGEINISG